MARKNFKSCLVVCSCSLFASLRYSVDVLHIYFLSSIETMKLSLQPYILVWSKSAVCFLRLFSFSLKTKALSQLKQRPEM